MVEPRHESVSWRMLRELNGLLGTAHGLRPFTVNMMRGWLKPDVPSGEAVRIVLERWVTAGALKRVRVWRPRTYQAVDLSKVKAQRYHARPGTDDERTRYKGVGYHGP